MHHTKKQPIARTLTLGSIALCIAYAFWYQISMHTFITTKAVIPVMLSTQINKQTLQSTPDTVTIKISGKRHELVRYLTYAAAHIVLNDHTTNKTTEYPLTRETLLVPSTIKLIDCTPHSLTLL